MQDCRVKSAASLLTERRDLSLFFFGVQNPHTKLKLLLRQFGTHKVISSLPCMIVFATFEYIFCGFIIRGRQSFVNSTSEAKQYGVLEECD
jgi:hypothetical protein